MGDALAMLYFEKNNYDIELQSIKVVTGKRTKKLRGTIQPLSSVPGQICINSKTILTVITDPVTMCLELYAIF